MQSNRVSSVIALSLCIFLFNVAGVFAADRVPWTTSRVVGSPEPAKPYAVQRVYPKLEFRGPVELMRLGNTGKMMLLEVSGKLYTFDDDQECDQADLAIDIKTLTGDFKRAFGFGVHPDFDNNREVFVVYGRDPNARPDGNRLSRFKVSKAEPFTIDPKSEEILVTWPSGGHSGSTVRFDSQGYLIFSAGDGARPYPPDEYDVGQDLSDLRATICRIDVDKRENGKPYAIPPDNPFLNVPNARPEIWAFGFRNPWRFCLVPGSDRILCGDVGWELWELIHDVRRGRNHGWSIFEGPQPIRGDIKRGPVEITHPLVSYPHSVGQSVTGGVVYQGDELHSLDGVYVYGDYVTGLVWGIRPDENPIVWNPVLAETGLRIITFAYSKNNEVLIVDHAGGIYKLIKNKIDESRKEFPVKLSQTGLFTSTKKLDPAPGVYPYQLKSHAWQGGAQAEFCVALPDETTVKTAKMQRSWRNPKGAVYVKTLSKDVLVSGAVQHQRIETQLLHFDGVNWQPYSYLWNSDQTDADLVHIDGGSVELNVPGQGDGEPAKTETWRLANRAECRTCHTPQTGGAVGFTFENLGEQQTSNLVARKILDRIPPKNWKVRYMVDPRDETESLRDRARSYLMANCAHCHRRGGGGTVPLDLVYSNPNVAINAIGVEPTQGKFGMNHAKVIAPGRPFESVLYYRMATSGAGHMPKLWDRENDERGLATVHDWIASLGRNGSDTTEAYPNDSTSAALRDFHALLRGDLAAEDRANTINRLAGSSNPLAVDLVERFLPPDQRRKRLGKNIDPQAILALKGNVANGRARYFTAATQQCINCHRVQGTGNAVGPDLDGLGKKPTKADLLTSILKPSKDIDQKFKTHAVLTAAGVVHTGLLVNENANQIVLRVANGKNVPIIVAQIEARKVSERSLMPEGLAEQMTAQELADLIAFLHSLD